MSANPFAAKSATTRIERGLHLLLLVVLASHSLAARAQPVTLWVTNTNSAGPGSLPAAIQLLQPASAVQQQIRFAFPTTDPVGISNVISLSQPLPTLDGIDLLLDGSDVSAGVIIDGNGHPILSVPSGASTTRLIVSNLTLRRGGIIGRGACLSVAKTGVVASVLAVRFDDCRAYLEPGTPARGAALYSAGEIEIYDSVFRRNEILSLPTAGSFADASGGAVFVEGNRAVTIGRSRFEDNRVYLTNTLPSFCTSGSGGAVSLAMAEGAAVLVRESTFTGNQTPCRNPTVDYDIPGQGDGGAIVVYGTGSYSFRSNFFSANVGRRGGAIGVDQAFLSTLDIGNNTFHANRGVASGGAVGIINCCTVSLDHNTFVDNQGSDSYGSQLAIVGGNLQSIRYNAMSGASPACTAQSFNVIGPIAFNAYADDGCGIAAETDAIVQLGAMTFFAAPAMNGGEVLTMAPAYGSPVIDAGPDDTPCAALYDARGTVRPLDGDFDAVPACDIGALESTLAPPPGPIFASGFEDD